jgi:hypothetical protein
MLQQLHQLPLQQPLQQTPKNKLSKGKLNRAQPRFFYTITDENSPYPPLSFLFSSKLFPAYEPNQSKNDSIFCANWQLTSWY